MRIRRLRRVDRKKHYGRIVAYVRVRIRGFGKRISKNGTEFTYGNENNPIAQSNGLELLGNITAILDSAGGVVVKYVYDAWGNHAVTDADGNDAAGGK